MSESINIKDTKGWIIKMPTTRENDEEFLGLLKDAEKSSFWYNVLYYNCLWWSLDYFLAD